MLDWQLIHLGDHAKGRVERTPSHDPQLPPIGPKTHIPLEPRVRHRVVFECIITAAHNGKAAQCPRRPDKESNRATELASNAHPGK